MASHASGKKIAEQQRFLTNVGSHLFTAAQVCCGDCLTNSGGRFAPGGCTVDLQLPAASDDERRERMQKYVLDALDAELQKRVTLTRILE
jgi:hypothetical protein